MKRAVSTGHAVVHAQKRLRLPLERVRALIDENKFVFVGRKPGTRIIYLLFYSVQDQAHFIAAVDRGVGSVVTVLPLRYMNRSFGQATLDRVRDLACNYPDGTTVHEKFIFVAVLEDTDGSCRSITLGYVLVSEWGDLAGDPLEKLAYPRLRRSLRQIRPSERCVHVKVRKGRERSYTILPTF